MAVRRVLVIEDEDSAREALESLLVEEGFQVRSAPTGLTGLASYRDFRPDVVLCDYYLPDVDGLQVLRRIREANHDGVRFIMVTAGLSEADTELAMRREADAFLGKPIDLDQLHHALWPGSQSSGSGELLNATS